MTALALLGAVFLWRVEEEQGYSLTFSPADLVDMRASMEVTEPHLSGASLNGDLYDFRAATVVPETIDIARAQIEELSGKVSFRDGRVVWLTSDHAMVDFIADKIMLESGIIARTSDGYTARANLLTLNLATSVLTADGPVTADGPLGQIEAGHLRIEPADNTTGIDDALIHFDGGVTLRYNTDPG